VAKSNTAQFDAETSSGTAPGITCHQCGSPGPLTSRDFVTFLLNNAFTPADRELPPRREAVLARSSCAYWLAHYDEGRWFVHYQVMVADKLYRFSHSTRLRTANIPTIIDWLPLPPLDHA
jgi:hypothetical protein